MLPIVRAEKSFCERLRWIAALCAVVTLSTRPLPAAAQDLLQLVVPQPEYTLGRFHYKAPRTDGWRQIANSTDSLSLVYAEQKGEDKIDTKFGVALEAHEIPPTVQVQSAQALAELSKKQISEQRKDDVVGMSAVQAVPSIDNLYTYRLLVHSPIKDDPDGYEVYYVGMAPDKSQYIVIQCITKTQTYENDLYFTEFYGSLASLKYVPDASAPAATPPAAAATPGATTAPAAPAPPAASAPPAAGDKPATPAGH